MEIKKLEAAIEAILFTMGESVELSQIADAIQQDKETTRKIIQNMMDKYQKKIVVSRSLNWNSLISFAAKKNTMNVLSGLRCIPKSRHLQMLCWKRFPSLHINSR